MATELRWVEQIHARLLVRYGADWLRMWPEGTEDLLVRDWAKTLQGVAAWAIDYALDNLPERAPNASQFRALCLRAPERAAEVKRLKEPKANPQRVAAALSAAMASISQRKPLQWAYDLQAREAAGDKLTPGQRIAWRETLAERDDTTITGDFVPVALHTLPPGMQAAVAAGELKVATA